MYGKYISLFVFSDVSLILISKEPYSFLTFSKSNKSKQDTSKLNVAGCLKSHISSNLSFDRF